MGVELWWVSTTLTIITLIFVWYWNHVSFKQMEEQLKILNEQTKLQIFADYTKRYQEIILHFPEEINESTFSLMKLEEENKGKYDTTMRYMRVYFDLCSEEYYLNENKKLDSFVWNEWKEGMTYAFNKSAFTEAWSIINKDTDFYPEFTKFVNDSIKPANDI